MNANFADDMRLARRVAAGDESALEALYARHADPLFAFIYHHVEESRPDAEEIWQDTLVTALRSLPTYRGQGQLFTWLCGIARHKIADYYRRRGRSPDVFSDLSPADLAALAGTGPLPEDVLARGAARVRVVEALATLPEDYRVALVARYADGCSVGEIAQALGRTYKAAESLLSRARAAFRSAFSSIRGGQH
ncbi:MAG: RNA polymerase sigma factor [Planctomycetota bacterium]